MECYACAQEATKRCSRCGHGYCAEHGGELCAACLDPLNAAPSSVVFRLSLLGLLAASVLALWLLVRPPSLPGESSGAIRPLPTTSAVQSATASPTPSSPGASTPTPSTVATPVQPTPVPPLEYAIQEGDTVSGIAAAHGIRYLDLLAYNGLTDDEARLLQPGDVILIPQ